MALLSQTQPPHRLHARTPGQHYHHFRGRLATICPQDLCRIPNSRTPSRGSCTCPSPRREGGSAYQSCCWGTWLGGCEEEENTHPCNIQIARNGRLHRDHSTIWHHRFLFHTVRESSFIIRLMSNVSIHAPLRASLNTRRSNVVTPVLPKAIPLPAWPTSTVAKPTCDGSPRGMSSVPRSLPAKAGPQSTHHLTTYPTPNPKITNTSPVINASHLTCMPSSVNTTKTLLSKFIIPHQISACPLTPLCQGILAST